MLFVVSPLLHMQSPWSSFVFFVLGGSSQLVNNPSQWAFDSWGYPIYFVVLCDALESAGNLHTTRLERNAGKASGKRCVRKIHHDWCCHRKGRAQSKHNLWGWVRIHHQHVNVYHTYNILIHTYIHAYIHTYMHAYIHPSIHPCMHACMHAYIHTHRHTDRQTDR